MPLTRAQAAQEERNGNADEPENKEVDLGQVRSPFETELLATVQEQRDLLKEYKDHEDSRVSEVITILNDTMQNLSEEFARVCDQNRQLKTVVFQLSDRVDALESEMKLSQERSEKINAGVFASLHRLIKSELQEEFESMLASRMKSVNESLSTWLNVTGRC